MLMCYVTGACSVKTDNEDPTEVICMLVDLSITILGISFASSWLEPYQREKEEAYSVQSHFEKIF